LYEATERPPSLPNLSTSQIISQYFVSLKPTDVFVGLGMPGCHCGLMTESDAGSRQLAESYDVRWLWLVVVRDSGMASQH
jgi:hypothetical protein